MSIPVPKRALRAEDILRSLLFYPIFYGGTFVTVGWALISHAVWRDQFVRAVSGWTRFHRWCVQRILGVRIAIEGEVPHGQVLVALKHESFFEAIDLPVLLPYPAIFAKIELLRIPIWGRLGASWGLIGVERDQGAKALRAMITAARKMTDAGRPLAIFPEGTRVRHGCRPPLQAGFAGLYKLIALPVVPVALDSGPLLHGKWKRRGTVTIRFGETIPPGLPRAEIEERVHAAINALNPPVRG